MSAELSALQSTVAQQAADLAVLRTELDETNPRHYNTGQTPG